MLFLSAAIFAVSAACTTTVIVPLISMYASKWLHKLDFKIIVLNLIWLLLLYFSSAWFILTQFFVLNLNVEQFNYITNVKFVFFIYIRINLESSINCFLFSFGILASNSTFSVYLGIILEVFSAKVLVILFQFYCQSNVWLL